ncbi:unnamed protein product [Closterium sp. Naga37s-1]|nr:unnamed protein product [Closterium sp. Naga37s-1]
MENAREISYCEVASHARFRRGSAGGTAGGAVGGTVGVAAPNFSAAVGVKTHTLMPNTHTRPDTLWIGALQRGSGEGERWGERRGGAVGGAVGVTVGVAAPDLNGAVGVKTHTLMPNMHTPPDTLCTHVAYTLIPHSHTHACPFFTPLGTGNSSPPFSPPHANHSLTCHYLTCPPPAPLPSLPLPKSPSLTPLPSFSFTPLNSCSFNRSPSLILLLSLPIPHLSFHPSLSFRHFPSLILLLSFPFNHSPALTPLPSFPPTEESPFIPAHTS